MSKVFGLFLSISSKVFIISSKGSTISAGFISSKGAKYFSVFFKGSIIALSIKSFTPPVAAPKAFLIDVTSGLACNNLVASAITSS